MRWLRLVGSLKLYVSFAEHSLFYRALLQKRRILLRSLLIVATPYPDIMACLNEPCVSKRARCLCKKAPHLCAWCMLMTHHITRICSAFVRFVYVDDSSYRTNPNSDVLRLVGSLKLYVSFAEHSLIISHVYALHLCAWCMLMSA